MFGLFTFLAYDREDLMVAALAALVVAGAIVAVGAWLLLFREVRRGGGRPASDRLAGGPAVDEQRAAGFPDGAAPEAPEEVAGEDRNYS